MPSRNLFTQLQNGHPVSISHKFKCHKEALLQYRPTKLSAVTGKGVRVRDHSRALKNKVNA